MPATGPGSNPFAKVHDFKLAEGFTRAFQILEGQCKARTGSSVKVVISGDLTAKGAVDEFANAQTFLGSDWLTCFSRPSVAGLRLGLSNLETVAGNHDYWGGLKRLFSAGGLLPRSFVFLRPRQFRETPWRSAWRSSSGSLELELYGLDSNAGMRGRNPFARGAIAPAHLKILDDMLEESKECHGIRRARAVVIHHSLLPTRLHPLLALDSNSRDKLLDICSRHGVSAILCGHTHSWGAAPLQSGQTVVYELRSPSTLQGPADVPGAGFLFHRLTLKNNKDIKWQTYLYLWGCGKGFQPIVRAIWTFNC